MRFDWDRDKEAVNVAKHGVHFSEVQSAFADPLLVLAADKGHSQKEPRLFCIGRSGRGGILTVPLHLSGRDHSDYRRGLLAKRQKNL